VKQPLKDHSKYEELEALARVSGPLHELLETIVQECGGTYRGAPRKSYDRCVQKVKQDYGGDYSRLLDLERGMGLFEDADDMLKCLQRLHEKRPSLSQVMEVMKVPISIKVVRCKDRLNKPLESGYRDILLNVCEERSGFVAELQLVFSKIADIKSQSHRCYELGRVMELAWPLAK